jgi:cellulose synthase (UDP-forming)
MLKGKSAIFKRLNINKRRPQSMKQTIPYETLGTSRKAVVFVFLSVAVWYLTWRLGTINRQALVFSWLLYAAELYGFCTTLMHLFMTWRLTIREAPLPAEGLSVDVFVTTINEPVALLRRTLLAVVNTEYPHQTWLLDDGRRPEMEALARELGCRYQTRPDNRDSKAGNLNSALLQSKADYIAVFDADHAPKKSFLIRTLGYFLDPSVAFVQTPQDFYNLDSFQHHRQTSTSAAWHEQSVFFRVIQRGKDYMNAAFFCGSCAIIRRSALDAIGGFAVGTVTEDLHTSLKIHKKGFKSVYHAESLAFGLAPSGLAPYLKQRIRWGQGAMQVWRKEGIIFGHGLTIAQRINYLASAITYFDGWQKGLYYVTPALVLLSGVMPLIAFGRDFLIHFIPYFLLNFLVFEEVNRGYGRSLVIEQYNMARFAAMAWSTLGIFKGKIKFDVTPKQRDPMARTRTYIFPQYIIMTFNLFAVPIGLFLYFQYHHLPANGILANIIWASANSAIAISVLLFVSIHSKFKREDYRFPIPFPSMIQLPNGIRCHGTISDISSSGFRIHVALPEGIEPGTKLTGELYLPTDTVKFEAEIKALIPVTNGKKLFTNAIGCSFVWSGSSEHDKLDKFLYGTDIQWSLNNLKEVIRTPLDRLWSRFPKAVGAPDQNLADWNAVVYVPSGADEMKTGLITSAADDQPRKVLAYSPIPEGTSLQMEVCSSAGVSSLAGRIGLCELIDTSESPLYIHQFIPSKADSYGHKVA